MYFIAALNATVSFRCRDIVASVSVSHKPLSPSLPSKSRLLQPNGDILALIEPSNPLEMKRT